MSQTALLLSLCLGVMLIGQEAYHLYAGIRLNPIFVMAGIGILWWSIARVLKLRREEVERVKRGDEAP